MLNRGWISGRLRRGRKSKIAGFVFEVGIELLLLLEFAEFLPARGVNVSFGVVVGTAAGDDQGAPADPGGGEGVVRRWVLGAWCVRWGVEGQVPEGFYLIGC